MHPVIIICTYFGQGIIQWICQTRLFFENRTAGSLAPLPNNLAPKTTSSTNMANRTKLGRIAHDGSMGRLYVYLHLRWAPTTWMSQEVRINGLEMGYNLLINGVYGGYNPLTNHLLTSWDIQVVANEVITLMIFVNVRK